MIGRTPRVSPPSRATRYSASQPSSLTRRSRYAIEWTKRPPGFPQRNVSHSSLSETLRGPTSITAVPASARLGAFVAVAGHLARELVLEGGDVGVDHQLDPLSEAHLRLPAELLTRL